MLKTDTYALATPEGRKPGTAGHRAAVGYLRSRYAEIGLVPYGDHSDWQQTYRVTKRFWRSPRHMHNLIGVVPGRDRRLAPTLIGAHFDSVIQSYCADDNATSVAAMLDVAQRLMNDPLEGDVIIAAFDGEEPPYFHSPAMGSTRFVQDMLGNCHLAVIMDLIGHPIDVPGIDPSTTVITGLESDSALRDIVPLDGDLPLIAVDNSRVGDMSDHHAFRLAGHPFLFLSSGEWVDYHQPTDTPDLIDYAKVARVATTVEDIVRAADVTQFTGSADWIGDLEVETMTRHVAPELLAHLTSGQPLTEATMGRAVSTLRTGMQGWQ